VENKTFSTAFIAAQKKLHNLKKTESGYADRYQYAGLSALLEMLRPACNAEGIAIIQTWTIVDGSLAMITTLLHESGEKFETAATVPLIENEKLMSGIQRVGATVTYLRRYQLFSLFGIDGEDDDADKKSETGNTEKSETKNLKSSEMAAGLLKQLKILAESGLLVVDEIATMREEAQKSKKNTEQLACLLQTYGDLCKSRGGQ